MKTFSFTLTLAMSLILTLTTAHPHIFFNTTTNTTTPSCRCHPITLTPHYPCHPTVTTTATVLQTPPVTLSPINSSAISSSTIQIPDALITAAPDPNYKEAETADAGNERFQMTTYWACIQQPGVSTAHCGWHMPVIDASMPNGASDGRGLGLGGKGMTVVVGLSAIFVLGMM